jgi:hypothetical protein
MVEIDGELVEIIWGRTDGASAWLYENSTTINIGLTDNKHTSPQGMQRSEVVDLNEAGQVIGFSYRFEPPDMISLGSHNLSSVTAWLYEDGVHTPLGLTDKKHTGEDGAQFSTVTAINKSGLVAGYSAQYVNGLGSSSCIPTQLYCSPNTTWLYDPVRDETVILIGNQTGQVGRHRAAKSDGYSTSLITYLSENGEAYGVYSVFSGDAFSEERYFYYSREHGLHDLIDLIPELAQWRPLGFIVDGNSSGYVIGSGMSPEGEGTHVGLLIAAPMFAEEN